MLLQQSLTNSVCSTRSTSWGSLGFCVAGQEEALGEALVEDLEGSRSRIAAKSGRVWPFLAQKLACAEFKLQLREPKKAHVVVCSRGGLLPQLVASSRVR